MPILIAPYSANLSYSNGGPSDSAAFTITASGLTPEDGSLSVTLDNSTDFEVSQTSAASGFSVEQLISYTGSAYTGNIYVRLKSGLLSSADYFTEVSVSGGGGSDSSAVYGAVSTPLDAAFGAGNVSISTVSGKTRVQIKRGILPLVSAAEAHASTGDIRKLMYGLMSKFHSTINLLKSQDSTLTSVSARENFENVYPPEDIKYSTVFTFEIQPAIDDVKPEP